MKRWFEYSQDPNSAEVVELRRRAIHEARSPVLVDDRIAYLCALVSGKSILDVGVVEHTRAAADNPNWLHGRLRQSARQCLGVDVLEQEVANLCGKGFDVLCADVTKKPLDRQFEVIIAGEVIEHLDSPGEFVRNCATMLVPSGRLVITTPNPWYANAMLRNIFSERFVDSVDHVAWYDGAVLFELGQRHGLRLERIAGIGSAQPRTLKGRLFFWLRPALIMSGVNSLVFAKSVIYEFVRLK